MNFTKEDTDKIWDLFLQECTKNLLSEEDIIRGAFHRSFLGSKEKYRKIWERAVERFLNGEEVTIFDRKTQ